MDIDIVFMIFGFSKNSPHAFWRWARTVPLEKMKSRPRGWLFSYHIPIAIELVVLLIAESTVFLVMAFIA